MAYVFEGLEPREVLKNFYDFSQAVPRMNMESGVGAHGGSDFIVSFAREHGLTYEQDESLNVIVKKPASPGYETAPSVILEAHLDMVCAADQGVVHDFSSDPIEIIVDEDQNTVHANGTTLGADDGLGVAMILAVLESDTIEHPELECVFTVNEETDMYGARHLHYERLKSRIVMSLDATRLSLGGGGEYDLELFMDYDRIPVRSGDVQSCIHLHGLLGGHSGKNAYMERGNANMLVVRVLSDLRKKKVPFRIISFIGGEFTACAIARDAVCRISYPESFRETVEKTITEWAAVFKNELAVPDPYVELTLETPEAAADETIDDKGTARFIDLMLLLPDGLNSLHKYFDHKYESAVNVGVVEMPESCFRIIVCVRFALVTKMRLLVDKICRLCDLLGVRYNTIEDLPHWEYNANARIVELIKDIYTDMEPSIGQGCCEMGFFTDNMPGVEVIGVGPVVDSPHSPKENFLIDVLADDWRRFVEVLRVTKDY